MFWDRYWLPRPRCEDGIPLVCGDVVLIDGKPAKVCEYGVNSDGSFSHDLKKNASSETVKKGFKRGERVKRATPWDFLEAF